jgi:hypothetical protein
MARVFNGSSDYLEYGSGAVVTGTPLTMACWVRMAVATGINTLMNLAVTSNNTNHFKLMAEGGTVGDPIGFRCRAGGTEVRADSTTGYAVGTWHHACGVAVSATDRRVFIDGGSKGTETTSTTPSGLNVTRVGVGGGSSLTNYCNGTIAEAAVWNAALSDEEIAILAKGLSPRRMRPASIVAYWPLWGTHSTEIDLAAGLYPLTVTGATQANHAPVRPFSRSWWGTVPVIGAGAPATKAPVPFRRPYRFFIGPAA